jgi:hypothetical protein
MFIRNYKRREKGKKGLYLILHSFVCSSLSDHNFGSQTETRDRVIGIHSPSELETQLNDASMASLLVLWCALNQVK